MGRSNQAAVDQSEGIGADFLQLDVTAAPPGGMADWLTAQLRAAITDGRLPVGSRLPPTRVLATELRVSRGVVTEAYARLFGEGRVIGRGRAGTTVVAAPRAPAGSALPRGVAPTVPAMPFAPHEGTDLIDALRAAAADIDLTPGAPDLGAFPRAGWLCAERAALAELSAADLGYGDPQGAPALRDAVSGWLARYRGIQVGAGEIVIVSGVAQALALLAQVLRERGITRVAVEDPGSRGTRDQLRAWGITTPPVPVDDAGVRVDQLRASGARAVLLTPAHQFPTGVVLSSERRGELHAWARAGGLIIEDDYDAEHRYNRRPAPALASLLPEHVCYTGSVSKWLAPALRIGWMLAPPGLHDEVVAAKRRGDLGNPVLPQLVMAKLMSSGHLERHLRTVRARNRRRRDTLLAAINTWLPDAVVHGAAAGLHLTVSFPASFDDVDLAIAALHRGVKVQPLSWHYQQPARPGLVLGYSGRTATDIERGVGFIADALNGIRDAQRNRHTASRARRADSHGPTPTPVACPAPATVEPQRGGQAK